MEAMDVCQAIDSIISLFDEILKPNNWGETSDMKIRCAQIRGPEV